MRLAYAADLHGNAALYQELLDWLLYVMHR